jgi:hypothetical protein
MWAGSAARWLRDGRTRRDILESVFWFFIACECRQKGGKGVRALWKVWKVWKLFFRGAVAFWGIGRRLRVRAEQLSQ